MINKTSLAKKYTALQKAQKNGLIIKDIELGEGEEVTGYDTITIHYIGTTQQGKVFNNTYKKSHPITITLGLGNLILAFEQGLPGMKVGGKRLLIVPSEIGFANRIVPGVPCDSNLIFEIELLEISNW